MRRSTRLTSVLDGRRGAHRHVEKGFPDVQALLAEQLATTPRSAPDRGRLLIVSTQLPAPGPPELGIDAPLPGGVTEALLELMAAYRGTWVGAARPAGEVAAAAGPLLAVRLPTLERRRADRFVREALWPLLHDLVGGNHGASGGWEAHRAVNRAFALAVARRAAPADFVWAHGLELLSLAGELRRAGSVARTGLLLQTPFPSPDLLIKLPCWRALVADLLEFDLLGVPSRRDLRNLLACLRELVPAVRTGPAATVPTSLRVVHGGRSRTVTAGVYPLGVDVAEVERQAAQPAVAQRAAELRERQRGGALLVGVDPLDATRGLLEKLRAFEATLERRPTLRGAVALVQLVLPGSGEPTPGRLALKGEVERRVGQINGRFGTAGWVPVRYLYRTPSRGELLALYRAADVRLQTPLKDGLSMAALESCAADVDGRGVLVLSESSGAAEVLAPGALMVNPCDVEGTAEAIGSALAMSAEERALRAGVLRQAASRRTLPAMLAAYLGAARVENHPAAAGLGLLDASAPRH